MFGQNLTKQEIDSYIKEIKSNHSQKYSNEGFEGFYRRKNRLDLFRKPYSGWIIRNEEDRIISIDEVFGKYKRAYTIYYFNEIPVYILFYKKKRDREIKLSEIYYLNDKYVEIINNTKYTKENLIEYAEILLKNNNKAKSVSI